MVRPTYRTLAVFIWLLLHVLLLGILIYEWVESLPPSREKAFPQNVMVVGVDASFPPFAVDNGESLYGLDIDLANALSAELAIPVRFVNMGYDGLYDAVIDGQVDVVISALLFNPARTREVRYTRPYFDNGLVLITNLDSSIVRMVDLPGYSLALEYGSAAQAQARFWSRQLEVFDVLPYELPQYALDAVRLGHADAAIVDTTSYYLYQSEHPDWQSEENRYDNAFYSIAVRIDRDATWYWVDRAVESLQDNGRLAEIIDRWF